MPKIPALAADHAAVRWYLARFEAQCISLLDKDRKLIGGITEFFQETLDNLNGLAPPFADCPGGSRRCSGGMCVPPGTPCPIPHVPPDPDLV